MLQLALGILVVKAIVEALCMKVAWKKYMTTSSGLADDYPSLHVRVSERAVHGHWLFIYLIPAPSSRVPINNLEPEARERGRQRTSHLKRGREREQGQSKAWRFISAARWFVTTHRETNAYGKLQESPMQLWRLSIDFVVVFISVQYWLAVFYSEVILVYNETCK